MQFERRMTVVDSGIFETLDALLDGPFAICCHRHRRRGAGHRLPLPAREPRLRGGDGPARRRRAHRPRGRPRDRGEAGSTSTAAWRSTACPPRFTRDARPARAASYEVRAAPLDPPGCFVLAFRDVTGRAGPRREREAALDHAQHLLKELGHRVMNSFAAISAILAMEARAAPPEGRAALERVQGRVQALAALYRRLDGAPQVDRVEVADYLAGIVASFRDALGRAGGPRGRLPTSRR